MFISASGVLLCSANRVEKTRDAKHLSFPLRQLYWHLVQVKKMHQEGKSSEALDKLFAIWVDLDLTETEVFE